MRLIAPMIITPRLMAGVEIGGAFISIGYAKRSGEDGRVRYQYHIDLPKQGQGERAEVSADDLQSGRQGGDLREGLESLLSFLGAFAESVEYTARTGRESENLGLFPESLREWAYLNSDEISLVQSEVEENPDCIKE